MSPSSLPSGLVLSHTNCPPAIGDAIQAAAFEPPDDDIVIVRRFRDYLTVLKARRLHFVGPEGKTGEAVTVTLEASHFSRYTPAGRAKIKRRLFKRLARQRVPGVLLTLTIDPKHYTKRQAWENTWTEWARFRQRVAKFRQRQAWIQSLAYIAVIEQHKSGYPHLHVAYPGLRYLAPKAIISSSWRMGSTHVDGGHGRRAVTISPLQYVVKYLGKMSGWTEEGLAHLWHARARLYNLSRRLYIVPQALPAPGWTLTKIDYATEFARYMARRVACLKNIVQLRSRAPTALTP
jgi:hypothetical protein